MDDRVLCVFVTLDSTSFVFDHDKIRLCLDSNLIFSNRNFQVTSLNLKIFKNRNLHAEARDFPTKNKKQTIKNLIVED